MRMMKLSNTVKDTIYFFLKEDLAYDDLIFQKEEMRIPIELCPNYNRTLILKNISHNLPEQYDFVTFMEGTFSEEENYYVLTGRAFHLEEYEEIPFSLLFHEAEVEIQIFRAGEIKYNSTPWMHLYYIASEILDKTFLPGDYLNDAEKELLPLIAELSKLSYFAKIPEEYQHSGFSAIKSFLEKHQAKKALALIHELENLTEEKKRFKLTEKIHTSLNAKENEMLWRELYELIKFTQKEYPARVSAQITTKEIEEKRKISYNNKIEHQFE